MADPYQKSYRSTVEQSPYMVRTSFTNGQSAAVIADWLGQQGARKIVTMVSDWAARI
jgi:hypothetical protein